MSFHSTVRGPDNIHVAHDFEYINAIDREMASGFIFTDTKKLALQLDDFSIWILQDTTPTWVEVSSTESDSFIELPDTPSTFTAQAGNIVQVNVGENAVEFGQKLRTTDSPTFAQVTVGNTGLVVGTSSPFSDAAGVLTLQNIDALDATSETTIEGAIDALPNIASLQGQSVSFSGELTVEAAGAILNQDLTTDANPQFANLTLTGDLTVQGTTTTIDSTTVLVEDKNIELGVVTTPTDATADGGGITLKGTTDKTISWDNITDAWQFNQNVDVAGNLTLTGTVDGIDVGTDVPPNTTHRSSDGKDHSDVVLNNTHRISDGKDHSDVVLNNTHRGSDGSDHGFIDQDVTQTAAPTFASAILNDATKAFKPNKGTTAQKDAITAVEGDEYYDLGIGDKQIYDGVSWVGMGGGDVSGPATSIDNAIVRFNATTGKNIQNSGVIIDDTDAISGITKLTQKPATPTVIETESRFDFGQSRGVFIQGNYAYVPAIDQDILNILDITEPTQIEVVGKVSSVLYSNVQAIHVIGNYAYTAGNSRFAITDVTDPGNPIIVGSLAGTDFDASTKGLHASGDYVYVISSTNSKLSIIDVSDPTAPFVVGSFVDAVNMIEAQGVYVVGKYAYVVTGTEGGLQIIDVSDPTTPVRVGGLVDLVNMDFASKAVIQGNYAYVACTTSDNVEIINISNPQSPVSVGRVTDSTFLNQIIDIKVFGDYAYTISNHATAAYFTIIDVSNPQSPIIVESLLIGQSLGFDISGNIAIVTELSTTTIRVVSLGGVGMATMSTGSAKVSELNVLNNVQVGQDLDVKRNIHVGGIAIVNDPISPRSSLNKRIGLGTLVEPVKTTTFDIPINLVSNTLYKLVDTYTDALEHVIPVSSNSSFESTSIDVNTYSWTGTANDLLLDGTSGILSFAQDKTIIVSTNGGQYMNILGSGSGFFVIKGGSEIDFFDKVGVIKDHSFNVRGAGFIDDQDGITMINCRSNWTSFGYIAFADYNQIMMDIALGSNPVTIGGGDISLFAGDTAFLVHNGAPASARLIIETNNFGDFTGIAFGSNTTGVITMAATSPVGGTLVTPAVGSRIWDGDTLIGANFATDTQYNVGGIIVSNTILNENGTAASYEIDVLFDGSADLTGDFTMTGLDQTDPRILCTNNSGLFPVSRTIAFGEVNDNTITTTLSDGVYTPINVTGFTANSVTERFSLTNAVNAIWTYKGLNSLNGQLNATVSAVKTGGTANYRFAISINGAVPVFASAAYTPMEVKTTKVLINVLAPVSLTTGDTIQIMIAGDGTGDDPTLTDFTVGIS